MPSIYKHTVARDDGIRGIMHPIWPRIISWTCRTNNKEPNTAFRAFLDVSSEVLVGQSIGNPPAGEMGTNCNPISERDVFYREWMKHMGELWMWCLHLNNPFMTLSSGLTGTLEQVTAED